MLVESATSGGGVRTTLATAGSASMATPSLVSKQGLRRSLSPVPPSVMTADSNCHMHPALKLSIRMVAERLMCNHGICVVPLVCGKKNLACASVKDGNSTSTGCDELQ